MWNIIKSISSAFFVLMVLVGAQFSFAAAAQADDIKQIRIDGAQRIETDTIRTYLSMKAGDELDQQVLDRAVKDLFSTGMFADIQAYKQGGTLRIEVKENPIINKIAFEGNDDIETKQLRSEIKLQSRQVFARTKVQDDVNRLYQIYRRQGRFSAKIEPKVIELEQNRVNLVFEIEEGPVTTVQSIRFVGNKRYRDAQLRDVIATQESRWYKFLSSNDRYDPDRLSHDEELLRRFYLKQGYADFRITSSSSELSKDRKNFHITFTVEEGERYKVGRTDIDSRLRDFDATRLKSKIALDKGDWYNAEKVQQSVDQMTSKLGNLQYAFVSIKPKIQQKREENKVNITFVIEETPRVFVERIRIQGNVRTLDRVIRREMDLAEGDPFNRMKLDDSKQAIKDLGYFKSVKVDTRKGSREDQIVVDVNVKEKSTGQLSVGGGFSTADGPLANVRLQERNLLGRGQKMSVSTTLAGERSEFDVSFTEPYFLGRDLSAGFDAFHITRDFQDESSFDQTRTGGGLHLGYPLSANWNQRLRYRIERNDTSDVQGSASTFIEEQEGIRTTSAISQRLTYDTRDSKRFPTDGVRSWIDTELAGLGGNAKFVKGELGTSYFYPIAESWTLNIVGEAGAVEAYADEDVEINERFFIGSQKLRGFDQSGIGPRDLATDDALGGNRFYRGSAELSFPLGLPEELGVEGHAFTDAGSLWDIDSSGTNLADESSVRAAAGIGFSWRSPMGPIRMNYAVPYAEEEFDDEKNFNFSFGTRF